MPEVKKSSHSLNHGFSRDSLSNLSSSNPNALSLTLEGIAISLI